jgi:predicted nucleic acid-binding protein
VFTVVYDANVLYSAPLRDLLVRLARTRLFHGRWTDVILDEAFRSIVANRPDLDPAALERTRALLCQAVPDCLIEGWEPLVDGLDLPDPDDRHVLAAAIRAGAQVIVTSNVKDFPPAALEPFHIEAQHPDVFILGVIDLDPGAVVTVVHQQQKDLVRKPMSVPQLLDLLERQGLVQSVTALRTLLFDD